MHPNKLLAKATDLRELIEEGDELPETIDTVFSLELRKQIKKRWPLIDEHLETVEEKLSALGAAQDELFHQLDVLSALSGFAVMQEAADRAEADLAAEPEEAHPVPEDDD